MLRHVQRLLTLAYPRLSADDTRRIDAIREMHDPNVGLVRPHFTLVFGCEAVPEPEYVGHVRRVSLETAPIHFVCRYAMLGSDDEVERAYVFLVPDEGSSQLARLHDALYRGALAKHLRLDLPYVPHITVGASSNRLAAKRVCDELNDSGVEIQGTVNAITVAARDNESMRNVVSFALERQPCESSS